MSAADLQSKDHRDLLDIIDQLRSQGMNKYIDLPEIIVCGDQSAGKSSVLEAISGGMSFPTKDSLCTRFATELILRRDSTINAKVSIIPDPGRFPDEKETLTSWQPKVNLEKDDLKQIIEEAKIKMGLQGTKVFSTDILRVELSGPDQPHLTMVDLPGLFKAGNKEQSADNVQLVKDMVTRFMNRPRSIILAVVSAKTEYVLQEVTALAKLADPDGLRTIGLITKPDTLDAGSESEGKWVDVALNKDVVLKLGWHVLKNRSYDEREYTSAQRDAAEDDFFNKGIWNSIDSSSWGIQSLKNRLSSVLKEQIMAQLPSLVKDVEISIENAKRKLDRLGAARSSPEEQLQYLSRVSEDFASFTKAAVEGNYTDKFFGNVKTFDGYEKRLRAVVQTLLTDFARRMRSEGESRIIIESDQDEDCGPRRITRAKYIEEVTERMRCSRGRELPGLFNPLIVGELFSQQCQPWRGIVLELTENILDGVYQATRLIIERTAAEEVAEEILVIINNEIEKLKMDMDQTIKELLQPHYGLHAITYNSQLTANVQEAQRTRNKDAITRKIRDTFGTKHFQDPDSKIYINPAQIVDIFLNETETDMDRFGSSIVVDYMQAYYKVALERFIDDISVIAIEGCLISKLPSLLTPSKILQFDSLEIQRLVGESEKAGLERSSLTEKLRALQKALQDIKRLYKHRGLRIPIHPQISAKPEAFILDESTDTEPSPIQEHDIAEPEISSNPTPRSRPQHQNAVAPYASTSELEFQSMARARKLKKRSSIRSDDMATPAKRDTLSASNGDGGYLED